MLAAVKTRRTDFEVRGTHVPGWLLEELKKRYGGSLKVLKSGGEGDEESVVLTETDWYREIRKRTTPGDALRLYRENRGLSQEVLAAKLGPRFKKQHVCDMERGRRPISKVVAKKLAEIFTTSPARFI
jgi:DNA-binding XRE family transcriptional regulator